MKAFCSWSGGKESCLALYRTQENFEVAFLLNMISENGIYSRSHGIDVNLLKLQAETIGIEIIQPKSSWESYEAVFKKTVYYLKNKGVNTGIFGDIDLQEHRDWSERVCKETGIKPLLPLWKEKREILLNEFISRGFKAIIVCTNAKFLDKKWLGREINKEFTKDIKNLSNVDLCGENGEYHTFVYDGPIFKKPVKFITGEKKLINRNWFLELKLKRS